VYCGQDTCRLQTASGQNIRGQDVERRHRRLRLSPEVAAAGMLRNLAIINNLNFQQLFARSMVK